MEDAFVLRISPSGRDRVPEARQTNELIIGWSGAQGLMDEGLDWYRFRQIVHDAYHSAEKNYTRAGGDAGHLWRFVREMKPDDFVVVPYGEEFFVARVVGEAYYDEDKASDDTAYRRPVEWLNGGKGILRRYARAALQSRMKIRGTCARATDLLSEIQDAIQTVEAGKAPSFEEDLRRQLIDKTLEEIRSGRIDSFGFERLVAATVRSLGASEVRILSRSKEDKGADIVASFPLATTFEFALAIQAKHFQPDPPVNDETVDQLIRGMEAEGTDLGWIVTSGVFSEEALTRKVRIEEDRGFQIQLIDGEQLAAMIVEGGLKETHR